jgi:hypothetical protein
MRGLLVGWTAQMSCADEVADEGNELVLACSVIIASQPFVRGDNGPGKALPCKVRDGDSMGRGELDSRDELSKSNVANISLHTLISVVATVLIVETGTRRRYMFINSQTLHDLRFVCETDARLCL